jgi:hypothetical protein
VLAGGQQAFHDFAVEGVRDHDAHDVDVIGLGDRLPRGVMAFVAETLRGEGTELGVDVADGDQPDRRKNRAVERRRRAVRGRMGFSCHSGADYGNSQTVSHRFLL